MCIRDRESTEQVFYFSGFGNGEIVAELLSDVLPLDQSVVALGELTLQHTGILGADVVEGVLLCRNVDTFAELIETCLLIATPYTVQMVRSQSPHQENHWDNRFSQIHLP